MMRIGYVFRQKATLVQLREIQMVKKKRYCQSEVDRISGRCCSPDRVVKNGQSSSSSAKCPGMD
jgi:hypothetical protein